MVYSYISPCVQPLQKRVHPRLRYKVSYDPSRFSPEKISPSEIFKRTCRVLDNFNKLPAILTTLYNSTHPPEVSWVSTR